MDNAFTWDIKAHGDLLELTEVEFIRNKLPAYEDIWKIFIGHDGVGEAANLLVKDGTTLNKTDEISRSRKRFSQYHYTILESLRSMRRVCDTSIYIQGTENQDLLDKVTDSIVLFHAQMGRAKDCIGRAADIVKVQITNEELDQYWTPRCIVLHGPRIPIAFQNSEFLIVPPSSSADNSTWNDNKTWDEMDIDKVTLDNLAEYFTNKFENFTEKTCSLLYRLKDGVIQFMEAHKIKLESPKLAEYSGGEGEEFRGISGIPGGISGVPGISGLQGKPTTMTGKYFHHEPRSSSQPPDFMSGFGKI